MMFSTTTTTSTRTRTDDDDGNDDGNENDVTVATCERLREILRPYDHSPLSLRSNRASVTKECVKMRTEWITRGGDARELTRATTTAFAYECERSASALALAECVNVKAMCAEHGVVPYHAVRMTYHGARAALARRGETEAVEALDAYAGARAFGDARGRASNVTPWTLTANEPFMDAKIVAACVDVKQRGFAVVDGALGEAKAEAVRDALERYVVEAKSTFTRGELDQAERSIIGDAMVDSIRDDSIAWLTGDERGLVGAFAQFMRVTLLNPLHLALGGDKVLAPVDSYVSNVMLSVYENGARGFVPHVDNMGPHVDPRALTAVYYPTSSAPSEGGALVLFPSDPERAMKITPTTDRLVLFASARVPHEVEPRSVDARSRRIAASFWYIGDPNAVVASAP